MSYHTHVFQDLVDFYSMYETRVKELWELAARFGLFHVEQLIKTLEYDLELREKEFDESDPKLQAIENAQKMNRYIGNIYREWSKLVPLLKKKTRLNIMGGKMASKEKAEVSRSIQQVRNQTCYNKRKLIEMELDDIGKYVELIKTLIEEHYY